MTDLPERFLCLTQLFPDDVALLATLISQDSEFSTLCEDLALSVDVLRRLDNAEPTTNTVRRAEYRMIFEQLQREVRDSLVRYRK